MEQKNQTDLSNICKDLAYRTKRVGKTAVTVDKSRVIAVISCLKEDIGWTKCVGKNVGNH